jgi:hypothetical protein
MVGDLCLATAVWAAVTAARGRVLERPVVVGVGVAVAALVGPCVRQALQVVLLRDFYRPLLLFTGASRAAAIGWGTLMALVLVCGFLAPIAVAVANLLPRSIRLSRRLYLRSSSAPVRWLARRHWWLVLPFVALGATVAITQWILPRSLASAMGYNNPLSTGAELPVSLSVIGVRAWSSFAILAPLPLLTGMWAGVEAARTCHRLVKNPSGSDTKLLILVRRFDYRLAAGLFVASAVALAIVERNILVMLAMPAGAGIVLIVVLSMAGALRGMARVTGRFERSVSRWQLPEEWRQVGPVSLVIAVLALPLLSLLTGQLYRGGEAAVLFPFDAHKFYFYWRDYGLFTIPHTTVTEIFGNVDVYAGAISAALAISLLPILADLKGDDFRPQIRWGISMGARIALLALLIAPVMSLADHSYAMFLLVACAIPILSLADRKHQATLAWSALLAGGALSLWSLTVFRTEWIPAAIGIGFTALQRFVFNAGKALNTQDDQQKNRIAYLQAIALLSTGMLVLGHGATAGFFDSDAMSSIADRVALSVVAILWLVLLISTQELPREKTAPAVPGASASAPNLSHSPAAIAEEVPHDISEDP